YLGLPPFFIGEIALVAGTVIGLRSGCLVASLASLPGLFLAAAMEWVLARTLPFIGSHGFEALRDSVVVMYGGFAFVVVALLLEDPRRLDTIVRYYGIFLTIYVPAVPFVFVISKYMTDAIPRWPGVNVPVLLVQ